MKKYNHPIDDFFRETLNDHQMAPSDAAKKAFLSDVMLTPPPEKKGRNGWILLSVLLALVGSGIIIWAITAAKTTSTPPRVSAPAVKTAHSALSQQTDPENKTRSDQKENKPNPGQATPSPAKKQGVMIQMPYKAHTQSSGKTIQDIKEETSVKESITAVGDERVITPANASLVSNPPVSNELADAGISDNLSPVNQETPVPDSLSKIKKQDSTVLPAPVIKTTSTDARNRNSRWNASLGVYYTPEWMFNTLEGSKFVNNFGIEGTFHFDRFSIRTGAGLSMAKGTNELLVEYNEFLGAYSKLDSIDFTWSEPIQNFTPTMYLSKKDVWDSLMKLEYAKVVKRYTYLQIPMIMGYDFWQSDRISFGVRVGPVLSVLIATKQLSPNYDPGTKRIISINDIAPEQVSLNWQVMAGFNTAIRLTGSLNLEIEPWARYYFNSVYEKPVNNTKPWSIGVRAAFVVKL